MTSIHSRLSYYRCSKRASLGGTLLLTLAACHATPPPAAPAQAPAMDDVVVVTPPPPPAPAPPPQATIIRVSPDILTACGISDVPSGNNPLFAFDSSTLSPDDQRLLAEVATCFDSGPLTGRAMTLTGRADPRGSEAYNMGLGQRRATSVAGFLTDHGLAASRVTESSRGALDAKGTDAEGWALDRRVDVDLVKPVPVASSTP